MEDYRKRWEPLIPQTPTPLFIPQAIPVIIPAITKEEVDEFHRLLKRAREFDRVNNQPDCEMQEKKDALLAIAEKLGVKINFDDAKTL